MLSLRLKNRPADSAAQDATRTEAEISGPKGGRTDCGRVELEPCSEPGQLLTLLTFPVTVCTPSYCVRLQAGFSLVRAFQSKLYEGVVTNKDIELNPEALTPKGLFFLSP